MAGDLLTQATGTEEEHRFVGVVVATVLDNLDATGEGRVQLSLPWTPDFPPWARVATLLAGPDTGSYFLPQIGDEVLVAFHQGDPNEPYVVGSLWNAQDKPPATPADPQHKFRLRTPLGHDLEFDDLAQTVTLTTTVEHTVRLAPTEITVGTAKGAAKVTLGATGDVTITAAKSMKLEAASIELKAPTIELSGSDVSIKAGGHCGITAAMVDIN